MLLLDTNVISELRKANRKGTDVTFVAWSKALDWSDLYLSTVTIYELEIGILRLEEEDPIQATILRRWITDVLEEFKDRILPVTTPVALHCARLHRKRTQTIEDTLIAATAHVYRMKLVTRNTNHFRETGVPLINPWLAS